MFVGLRRSQNSSRSSSSNRTKRTKNCESTRQSDCPVTTVDAIKQEFMAKFQERLDENDNSQRVFNFTSPTQFHSCNLNQGCRKGGGGLRRARPSQFWNIEKKCFFNSHTIRVCVRGSWRWPDGLSLRWPWYSEHTLFYTCDNREEHLRHFFCYYRHSPLVLCACLYQIQERCCCLCFVILT